MGKLILYGNDLSNSVRACKLTFAELGLQYEFKVVNLMAGEHLKPEFLKMNPQHTVPVLDDDGVYIWDSQAICAYLVDKYAKDDQLYPKDLVQRAVVNQRLFFNTSIVYSALRNIMFGFYRDNITLVSKERVLDIIEVYNLFETFLALHPYIAGDHLTIADFCCICALEGHAGIVPIDASKYPLTSAWMALLEKLPYYEEANGKGSKAYKEFQNKNLTVVPLD